MIQLLSSLTLQCISVFTYKLTPKLLTALKWKFPSCLAITLQLLLVLTFHWHLRSFQCIIRHARRSFNLNCSSCTMCIVSTDASTALTSPDVSAAFMDSEAAVSDAFSSYTRADSLLSALTFPLTPQLLSVRQHQPTLQLKLQLIPRVRNEHHSTISDFSA